jgi:hypothetical protein
LPILRPTCRLEGIRRTVSALALALIAVLGTAARAHAQAAVSSPAADTLARPPSPFPEVPLPDAPRTSRAWSYGVLGTGVALISVSFLIADRADDAYQSYLKETEPGRIGSLFDRAVLYDRVSSGSLMAGEALLCLGLYWRFLRQPPPALGLTIEPERCAVSYRF